MNTLIAFGILILVIINFSIYHKIFDVVYFDLARGCATEIFWIVIFTIIEVAFIKVIILKILGVLGSLLVFVGKLILFGVIAAIVIFVAWKIVQMVKGEVNTEEAAAGGMASVQSNQDILEKKVSDVKTSICTNCGKTIKKDSKFCQFCGSKIEDNV